MLGSHISDRSWGTRYDDQGIAYAELLLIIPILLTLLFGSFEVSRYLRISESVSEMSRTIGEQVYRECLGLPDSTSVSNCITTSVQPAVVNSKISALTGMQVVITVWRNTSSPSTPDIRRIYYAGFKDNGSGTAVNVAASYPANTHYDGSTPTAASNPMLYKAIINNYKQLTASPSNLFVGGVAIIEVTTPYQPILSHVMSYLNLAQVYEQTIY
ncbi:MAG: hypothetical protein U0136_21245 [Bdellovibrionota bacterium]